MEAICARILPQDDRDSAHRIPIVPGIDERLFPDRHDGYRYENMPPDRDAYKLGLRAIDEMARSLHHQSFCEIDVPKQEQILESLHDARPLSAHEVWKHLPVHRFWMLLVQDCISVYYAHPWAWDEIGFGGPAYPRGVHASGTRRTGAMGGGRAAPRLDRSGIFSDREIHIRRRRAGASRRPARRHPLSLAQSEGAGAGRSEDLACDCGARK